MHLIDCGPDYSIINPHNPSGITGLAIKDSGGMGQASLLLLTQLALHPT